LAVSELCPDISAAAARILHVWRAQQAGRPTLVCTDHRN
jgi:hypothetical protein